jgi:predicted DNA-binding antitoxin AbrB/MazE fold protein
MAKAIRAIYENGLLRPLAPMQLRDKRSLTPEAYRQTVWLQVLPDETTAELLFDTQYQKVELLPVVTQMAGQLVNRHPLRAYDAVQLASALCMMPQLSGINTVTFTFLTE